MTFIKMRAKFVNEEHFARVDTDQIINKKYFDLQFGTYAHDYIEAYRMEEYISPEVPDEEIATSKEFKSWYRSELETKLEIALSAIDRKIKPDGTIDIWRAIMVDSNWLQHLIKEGQRLGKYWTYEKGNAEPHWGYNDDEKNILALLKSSVKEEFVDWVETLRLNTETFNDEKELRLFKNTPLRIEYLEVNYEPIDLKLLKGKIFKA